jgi:hypothetical protein
MGVRSTNGNTQMVKSVGAKLERTSHGVIRTKYVHFALLATCVFSIYQLTLARSVLPLPPIQQHDTPDPATLSNLSETSALDFVPANDPETLSNLSQSRNSNPATTTTTKAGPVVPLRVSDKIGVNSNSVFGITYGTNPFEKALNRLKQEADDSKLFQSFEICRTTDLDASFVDHFKDILELERGGGYWIWKVHLIQRHLERL